MGLYPQHRQRVNALVLHVLPWPTVLKRLIVLAQTALGCPVEIGHYMAEETVHFAAHLKGIQPFGWPTWDSPLGRFVAAYVFISPRAASHGFSRRLGVTAAVEAQWRVQNQSYICHLVHASMYLILSATAIVMPTIDRAITRITRSVFGLTGHKSGKSITWKQSKEEYPDLLQIVKVIPLLSFAQALKAMPLPVRPGLR